MLFDGTKKRKTWPKAVAATILSASLMLPSFQALASSEPEVQALNPGNAEAFLDSFFESELAAPHYVGAAVIIVKDGEVVAEKGYGFADKENEIEVNPSSSVFRIASVSKSFTAAAIMQLVEQGKLGLQDDFRDYINEIPVVNHFDQPVTIEHLLTQTTGFQIQDVQPEDLHGDFDKVVEIEDYVREHMPPVVREPGSSYMYDNFASLALGLIVQNVSGVPFEQYMQANLFEPLAMSSSSFDITGELRERMITEYNAFGAPIEPYAVTPTIMPQGGMLSTAEDIGKFMIAFLNGGKSDDGSILAEETVQAMTEYRSSIHPLLPNTTYGFEAASQLPGAGSSSEIITKAGDLLGNSSLMLMIPEQNTGVFLTYNQASILRELFYPQFIATFFPQYAAPSELEPFAGQSPEELARFGGYYSDLRFSTFVSTISGGDGDLIISDVVIGPRVLKQIDENLFVDELTYKFTAFQLDEDGNVLYMKEPYINPMGYARKGAEPAGFADIEGDSPYAEAILALQSLGFYSNNADAGFSPEQTVTRAEFLKNLLVVSSLKGSESLDYAFTDIEGHPDAAYIQQAYELGMVVGDGKGKFNPDQNLTRQEAAVMLWRIYALQYPQELFADVPLAGETDDWAVPAVQMMALLGLHGPEVEATADGAIDFKSKQSMNRQEEAALLFALLTHPTDAIVAALMQQQSAEEEVAESELPAEEEPESDDQEESAEAEEEVSEEEADGDESEELDAAA